MNAANIVLALAHQKLWPTPGVYDSGRIFHNDWIKLTSTLLIAE